MSWLQEYAISSSRTDQMSAKGQHTELLALGLFGEVGSILAEVKKHRRDSEAYPAWRRRLVEEIGDALWYLVRLYSVLAPSDLESLLEFPEHRPQEGETRLSAAIGLGQSMNGLLESVQDDDVHAMRSHLDRVWKGLSRTAMAASIRLQDAADENLRKITSRWPEKREYKAFFDEEYPEEDQIPRRMEIEFREREIGRRRVVVIRCNGLNVGNRLTDNVETPDAYRFHDVFHFAYAVYLGWSPVVRALLHCKRKSRPDVDENQDGARARVIEEGVSAIVFSRLKEIDLYRGLQHVDYDLLKAIQGFVRGFEVDCVPLWQWETAILKGHEAFRQLKENGGGHVLVDLPKRELRYRGPPGHRVGGR